MAEGKQHYFKVVVSNGFVGADAETAIGPYREDELDEYGDPPQEDFEFAVWELVEAHTEPIDEEEASHYGIVH